MSKSSDLSKQLSREMRNLKRRIKYAENKWGVDIDPDKVIPKAPKKLSKSYINKLHNISPVSMDMESIVRAIAYEKPNPQQGKERGIEQPPEWGSIVVQGFFSQAEALRFGGAEKQGLTDYASVAIDVVSADLGTYGIEAVAYALENNPSNRQEGIYIAYEDIMSQMNLADWTLGYKTALGVAVDNSGIADTWVENYEFAAMLNGTGIEPENPEAYE